MTDALVNFALHSPPPPADVLTLQAWHLADSLAVAVTSLQLPLVERVGAALALTPHESGVAVWGTHSRATEERAALALATAVRAFDLADTYFGATGCHPSDVTAAILVAADRVDAASDELLTALGVSYGVMIALADRYGAEMPARGWDHTSLVALAAVCGIGRLWRLSPVELSSAIGWCAVGGLVTTELRAGQSGSWRVVATGTGCGMALQAATLARASVTGPEHPFDGRSGLDVHLGSGSADRQAALACDRVREVDLKAWPVGFYCLSAVDAALRIRAQRAQEDPVERVEIATFDEVHSRFASPAAYAPTTHASADHSLPYVIWRTLEAGEITLQDFLAGDYARPEVHSALQHRVTVVTDAKLDAMFPEHFASRLTVTTRSGARFTEEVLVAVGDHRLPGREALVQRKWSDAMRSLGLDQNDDVLHGLVTGSPIPAYRELMQIVASRSRHTGEPACPGTRS